MAEQNISQSIVAILDKILNSGLAINGQISLNGLTITSTDKAKSLGILPDNPKSSMQGKDSSQQSESEKDQEKKSSSESDQQESSSSPSVEIKNLQEEVRYIRTLIESSQNQQGAEGQKSRSSQSR